MKVRRNFEIDERSATTVMWWIPEEYEKEKDFWTRKITDYCFHGYETTEQDTVSNEEEF
jgi:hypothetical protein